MAEADPSTALIPRERWITWMMGRHGDIMSALAENASAAVDPSEQSLAWLVAQREARRYLRRLQVWMWFRAGGPLEPAMARQRALLEARLADADAALRSFDAATVAEARRRLGVRVAVVGKGGVGKTVIASTLARLLARQGRDVIAADLDPNPGLAISLGLPRTDAGLPPEAVEKEEGAPQGWQLASGLTALKATMRFSTLAPDGVRYLGVGKIRHVDDESLKTSITAITQRMLLEITDPDWDIIGDLEAGLTQSFQGHHAFCDKVIVVVNPSWRSALTAHRLLPMFGDRDVVIVGNRFRGQPDHPGLDAQIRIPDDPEVADAERRGLSPLAACPDGTAMQAIRSLMGLLLANEPPPAGGSSERVAGRSA